VADSLTTAEVDGCSGDVPWAGNGGVPQTGDDDGVLRMGKDDLRLAMDGGSMVLIGEEVRLRAVPCEGRDL
jgi:hypothetical protein